MANHLEESGDGVWSGGGDGDGGDPHFLQFQTPPPPAYSFLSFYEFCIPNHLEESGDRVWGGGGGGGPQFQFLPRPEYTYNDPSFIAFQNRLLLPPIPLYFSYVNWFPFVNSRNMAAPASTSSPENQDQSNYEYWRQTYYSMYHGRGSTSGPDAIPNQNQNQQYQINNTTHSNVTNDSMIGHEFQWSINDDDDYDLLFPSFVPSLFPSLAEFPSWDYLAALDGIDGEEEELVGVLPDSFVDIRDIGSGLSDETISNSLKIRKFSHQEDPLSSSNYYNICVVCQDHICLDENNEEHLIGTLHCGHEYHADCIKQWLKHKNFCPLCKATALSMPTDESFIII